MSKKDNFIILGQDIMRMKFFKDSATTKVFITLLLEANFKTGCFLGYTIERGQIFTNYKYLSDVTGLTVNQIRYSLDKLRSCEEITSQRMGNYTLITVCNYDDYNGFKTNNSSKSQKSAAKQERTGILEQ